MECGFSSHLRCRFPPDFRANRIEERAFAIHDPEESRQRCMLARRQGIRKRAPLTAMVVDDDTLRDALKQFCGQIDGVRMGWALFVEKGSAAEEIAREELLLDMKVEGSA